MKFTIPILALIVTISVTDAKYGSKIINVKSGILNSALSAATSAIQSKQNLIRSSTSAITNAKTNFIQKQLPGFVQFKTNQINGLLELKKNLLRSKAETVSQLIGIGTALQAAEQDVAPYSPPVLPEAPPVTIEEHLHIPQQSPPSQVLPLPTEIPVGPYPPPSYLSERQQLRPEQTQIPIEGFHAQAAVQPQRESYLPKYSSYPTPPPPPPTQHFLYV